MSEQEFYFFVGTAVLVVWIWRDWHWRKRLEEVDRQRRFLAEKLREAQQGVCSSDYPHY